MVAPASSMLRWLADANPLRYFFDLLNEIMRAGAGIFASTNVVNLIIAVIVPEVILLLGSTTIRRQRDS